MRYIEALHHNCTEEGFYLMMNPVYDRAESVRAFGPFSTLQEAAAYHNSQLIRDEDGKPTRKSVDGDPYIRSFIQGPLANMNPLEDLELIGIVGTFNHGIVQARPVRALHWFPGNQVVPPQL